MKEPQDLFLPSSTSALEELCRKKPVVAFDFDGTLAAVTRNPEDACLTTRAWAGLEELSKFFTVAVLSGRKKSDVRGRVPSSVEYIAGNHGIECDFGTESERHALLASQISQKWILQIAETVGQNSAGIELEDKTFSVTFFLGRAPDQTKALGLAQQLVTRLDPAPRSLVGKNVINLLPPNLGNKETALCALVNNLGASCAIYVGDDSNDEDVFASERCDVFGIKIGKDRPTAARYFVPEQTQIEAILQRLCDIGRRQGQQF